MESLKSSTIDIRPGPGHAGGAAGVNFGDRIDDNHDNHDVPPIGGTDAEQQT